MDIAIDRSRTAISRRDISRPVRLALEEGFINKGTRFFDYGCGRGDDVRLLNAQGVTAVGWDPVFAAREPRLPSEIVNLGYVLNVIENIDERAEALRSAWELAEKVLVVAALVTADDRGKVTVPYADGVVTGLGTFQKYFTQGELKSYIEQTLGVEALASSLGVFYIFRDEGLRQEFLRTRIARPAPALRPRISQLLYENHKDILERLASKVAEYGRLPEDDELDCISDLRSQFGSVKKAFNVLRRVTGTDQWDGIARRRQDDVVVLLSLIRFGKRPPLSVLPERLQRDVRAFFGAYTRACDVADQALAESGAMDLYERACRRSEVGKLMPRALYVHQSSLGYLPVNLRILEGCARKYLGLVEGATVIKFHRREPTVSYLMYPTFFEEAHPRLAGSIKISLRTLDVEMRDYSKSVNPPILHRKEAFLHPSHSVHTEFESLTRAETDAGLLSSPRIGNVRGWERRLKRSGYELRGHNLVRREPPSQ